MNDVEDLSETTWLSGRESEVYEKYYVSGKTDEEIADELGIDSSTVREYLRRIRMKILKSERMLELFEEVDVKR